MPSHPHPCAHPTIASLCASHDRIPVRIPRSRPAVAKKAVPCTCWPSRPWPRRPFPPYDPFGRGGRPLKELPVLSLVPQDPISARSPLYLVTRGRPSWAARPFPRSCHLHYSHPPFGHERPSLLGSAPVPAVFAGTSCRLKAPASPASRGLRLSLRSRLRVAFWGWRRGSGDVAVRDRCGRGSPGPSGESWRWE